MLKSVGLLRFLLQIGIGSSVVIGSVVTYRVVQSKKTEGQIKSAQSEISKASQNENGLKLSSMMSRTEKKQVRKIAKALLNQEMKKDADQTALRELLTISNLMQQSGTTAKDFSRKQYIAKLKGIQITVKATGKSMSLPVQKTLNNLIQDLSKEPSNQSSSSYTSLVKVEALPASKMESLAKGQSIESSHAKNDVAILASLAPDLSLKSVKALSAVSPPPAPLASIANSSNSTMSCATVQVSDPTDSQGLLTSDIFTARNSKVTKAATQLGSPAPAFRFVRDSISFSGLFGASQSAEQVLDSGRGSSADKASLLIALLRAQGVPASYVTGEIFLTVPQAKRFFGVIGDNDVFWAICMTANPYYAPNGGACDYKNFSSSINGVTYYHIPETWVRAKINGHWIDLDPIDIGHESIAQNYNPAEPNSLVTSIVPWLFRADSQGNYIKAGTYADAIGRAENSFIQSYSGVGGSVKDTGAVNAGIAVTPDSLSNVTSETKISDSNAALISSGWQSSQGPCRENQDVKLKPSYQFISSIKATNNFSNAQLLSYSGPLAQLRSHTIAVTHSTGLLPSLQFKLGTLQLVQDDQILASAALYSGLLVTLNYQVRFAPRYSNYFTDRSTTFNAGDVVVVNQIMGPVFQAEVTGQIKKILDLQTSTDVRKMMELVKLQAMMVVLRQSQISKDLAILRGVHENILHSFTTSVHFGKLVNGQNQALGFVPVGTQIDWPQATTTYPTIGNFSTYAGYFNIVRYTSELVSAGSSLEDEIAYELFGNPTMSTVRILQTAALQNSTQSPANNLIEGYLLNTSTEAGLFNQFHPSMAIWKTILPPFEAAGARIYTTSDNVVLPSGFSGSAVLSLPISPDGGAAALIITNSYPVLNISDDMGALPSDLPLASGPSPDGLNAPTQSSTQAANFNLGGNNLGGNPSNIISINGGVASGPQVSVVEAHPGQASNSPSNGVGGCSGQPVVLSTGAMWHQLTDFEVVGRTAPTSLKLQRTYLSKSFSTVAGGFGSHWFFNYETRITLATDSSLPAGSVFWIDENGGEWLYKSSGTGNYSAAPGQFSTLKKLSDHYELHKKGGVVLSYSNSGRLISIVDPHGEKLTLDYDSSGQLSSVSSPFAGQIQFTFNSSHQIIRVKRVREGFNYSFSYNSQNQLASSTDFLGRVTRYDYNTSQIGTAAFGLLSSITDPIGRVIGFTYYNDGRAFTQSEPENANRSFIYSPYANDHLTMVEETDGSSSLYRFDNSLRQLEESKDDGARKQNIWSVNNQLVQTVDELGYATKYSYDSRGNLTSLLKPANQNPMTMTYDPDFDQLLSVNPPVGSPLVFTIDSKVGDVLSVQRKLGSQTLYENYTRDAFGNLLSTTTNKNQFTQIRDANGFLITQYDARNPSQLSYDNRGRLISQSDKSGRVLTFTYNDLDHITSVKDSSGPSIQLTYDIMQRLVKKSLTDGSVVQNTTYTFDDRDRMTSTTDSLGNTTRYSYAPSLLGCHVIDRPAQIIDPKGQVTRFEYDNRQRLTRKIAPDGSATRFEYNLRGDLIALTDPANHRSTYRRDANARLLSDLSPVAASQIGTSSSMSPVVQDALQSTTYEYDEADRIVSKKIGLNQGSSLEVLKLSYDDIDRVSQRQMYKLVGSTIAEMQDSTQITYENILSPTQISSVTNQNAKETFVHESLPPYALTSFSLQSADATNPLHLLEGQWSVQPADTAAIGSVQSLDGLFQLNYNYDPSGRAVAALAKFRSNQGDEGGESDDRYQPHFNSISFKMNFDGFGRNTDVRSQDLHRRYEYDLLNRVAAVHSSSDDEYSSVVAANEILAYDANSQINLIDRKIMRQSFGYDSKGQLTNVEYQSHFDRFLQPQELANLKSSSQRTFSYDYNGSRTQDSADGSSQFLDNQIISSPNTQYISDEAGQGRIARILSAEKDEQLNYRVDGKLSSYQRVSLSNVSKNQDQSDEHQHGRSEERDRENDKALDANKNIKVSYFYDGLGRRLAKVVAPIKSLNANQNHEKVDCDEKSCEDSSKSFTQSFAYLGDADQILLSRNGRNQLILQIDNQGSTASLGEHLGEISSSHRKAYQKDHLGSVLNSLAVSKETDSSSTIANKLYGAFGESNRVSINDSMPAVIYGFAGGELNAESGDYYFRARNYDPEIGRWVSKDPILFAGGDSNLYSYVVNDPINWIDINGHSRTVPTGSGGDPAGEPGGPGTSMSGGGGTVYVAPNGQAILTPQGTTMNPARNGNGTVFNIPGGTQIRLMGPENLSPNGYGTINVNGSYLDSFGNPVLSNSPAAHIQPTCGGK